MDIEVKLNCDNRNCSKNLGHTCRNPSEVVIIANGMCKFYYQEKMKKEGGNNNIELVEEET